MKLIKVTYYSTYIKTLPINTLTHGEISSSNIGFSFFTFILALAGAINDYQACCLSGTFLLTLLFCSLDLFI